MTDLVTERVGVPVLVCDATGTPIAEPQDALDVIGTALYQAEVVAIPANRLDQRFFDLRSGLAGEVMQKFESNRGRHVWFVADLDELDARLSAARPNTDRPN